MKFMWQETQNTKTTICSTVPSQARKPVNFESPKKMLLWFRNHLLGIGPHLFVFCFLHTDVSYSSNVSALSILHFFANLVAEDFVPVNLGAGDGQLPA